MCLWNLHLCASHSSGNTHTHTVLVTTTKLVTTNKNTNTALVVGAGGNGGGFRRTPTHLVCTVFGAQVAGQTLFPCSLCSWVVGVDYTGEVDRGGSGDHGDDDVCREAREREREVSTQAPLLC